MRAILMALAVLSIPAWTLGLGLSLEKRPAAADGPTTVGLFLQDARDLGYLRFTLSYDWDHLVLQAVRPAGPFAAAEILASQNPEIFPDESGRFDFAVVAPRGISGTQRVLELVFAVGDSVPEFVEVVLAEASAADTALQEVPVELEHGGVAVITAVLDEQGALPGTPALGQNFPNPFNSGTAIPFQLAEPAEVRLRVYNLLGQVVRDFDLGRMPAGFYAGASAVRWDGRDRQGSAAASGVYIVHMQAGDFVQVRKALLLK